MSGYKWNQVVIIVSFGMITNLLGRIVANSLMLPVWLDSFGTFLTAYVLGSWCGALVGIAGSILYEFINPGAYIYSIVYVITALIIGYYSKHGWLSSYLKTVTLSFFVSAVSTVTACIINFVLYKGTSIPNIWGQGIVDLFLIWNFPSVLCFCLGQFYVDFLDKTITLSLVFAFIRFYRFCKDYLPELLRIQRLPCILILFLSLFALPQKANADNRQYNSYVHITYNKGNGLSGGKANDIASTNDGILWIGTYEGLYRHNGNDFRLMTEYESIKAVRCLYVDDEGRLFVGTNDNGLTIIINERVTNVIEEKDGLPSDSIRCVTRSSNGLYYVGTAESTAVLSISDGLGISKIFSEIKGAVRISSDENEHVAAVTVSGELFLIKGTEIVWQSNKMSERFCSVSFSPDGLLLASTESGKVYVFVIASSPQVNSENIKSIYSVSCQPLNHINSINFYDNVAFLCADNGTGYIEGVSFHMIETGAFNNSIDNMTEDYQGNLWFTSSRLGVLKMCNTPFEEVFTSAGFPKMVINTVSRFKGDLYFGSDNGLYAIDSKTGRPLNNELTKMLSSTRVRCLMVTKKGDMWICTKSKGLVHAQTNGKITTYGAEHNHAFRVATELYDGTIAAGGNDGILFLKYGQVVSWIGTEDGLENPMILGLTEAADGTVLASTDGGGIALLNYSNEKWFIRRIIKRSDGLCTNVVLKTVNDYEGLLPTGAFFAITSSGLCYVEGTGEDSKIRVLSNFPYSNNYDMIILPNKEVFVLSSAGIFIVNRSELLSDEKPDYDLLDIKKGLLGSLTVNSWNYMDEEGYLYLSCDTGASRLNLNNYDRYNHSYRIQLKSVLVDDKRHIVQKDSPFVIPKKCTKVEIVPEIINYSINNPYIKLYMEGIDENPRILLQSELSSLIYTNLKAGVYRLHISILDSKGVKATEESIFPIIKAYNIYDNWWFMLYLVGVFVLIVSWLTWLITSSLLRQRMEKQNHQMEVFQKQVRIGNETIFSIANAVEARDKSTGKHSFRVAEYSVLIAKELGFSQDALDSLHKTGLLHDIGKIGVPDSILNKPTQLTDEEYTIMKTHVNIGGEILKDFSLIEHVADGAKFHHEHYDGTGYPNGLKGEEIPLNARIIGLADAFDAMTASRVYRKALDMDFVVSELKKCSGSQFDPGLVQILLELISKKIIDVEKTVEASANGVHYEE